MNARPKKRALPARLCAWGRELLFLQMLIALESGEAEILVGGQAVMEGVMMRAPHSYAVVVRRADGTLATTTRALTRPSEKNKIWSWPVLRGLATLGQAMALGVRALRFSSDQALVAAGHGDSGAAPPRLPPVGSPVGLPTRPRASRDDGEANGQRSWRLSYASRN